MLLKVLYLFSMLSEKLIALKHLTLSFLRDHGSVQLFTKITARLFYGAVL